MIDSKRFLYLLLFFAITIQMLSSSYSWNGQLLDYHAFRQTQTAISTYYMVEEGITVNYQTPVLGKPWQIPMEFPTYQIFTASIVKISGIPLDQAGRLLSLFFFYLSILIVFLLVRSWNVTTDQALIVVVIIISSPLYMFWSRTFMIESTALFFSVCCIYFFHLFLKNQKYRYLILASLVGILAGLTKITTFAVTCVFIVTYLWATQFKNIKQKTRKEILYVLINVAIVILPAILAGFCWNHHADEIKQANPLAENILSSSLYRFNFGTLVQRLSFTTWNIYTAHVSNAFSYTWNFLFFGRNLPHDNWYLVRLGFLIFLQLFFAFLIWTAFVSKKFRHLSIICAATFLSGPLVFANLYVEHEYYFYANAIFLLMIVGFGCIEVFERYPKHAFILIMLILFSRLDAYNLNYKRYINFTTDLNLNSVFQVVRENTKKEEVIMVFGDRWSSVIPYYSQRKAMMINSGTIGAPSFEKGVELVGMGNIGSIVACPQFLDQNDAPKIKEFIKTLQFKRMAGPFPPTQCTVFLR